MLYCSRLFDEPCGIPNTQQQLHRKLLGGRLQLDHIINGRFFTSIVRFSSSNWFGDWIFFYLGKPIYMCRRLMRCLGGEVAKRAAKLREAILISMDATSFYDDT